MRTKIHKTRPTFARALAGLLAVTAASPLWAAPGDMTQVSVPALGADPPKAKDISDGDMSVSTETGAFQYTYPITVPPGRLNMQPSLALSYSSQGANYGGIAAGWSLSIPEITLDTSDSLITRKLLGEEAQYVSSMAGGRPLVAVTEPTGALPDVQQTYRARNDSSWARYERMQQGSGLVWRVRTADGNTHYFGEASRAPQAYSAWAPLTRTEDSFGNTIEYIWVGWQIAQIRYTSNPAAALPAFARVDFVWAPPDVCDGRPVGAQEDRKLGITRGINKLSKIRAVAFSDTTDQHTREITLGYSPTHVSCTNKQAPMRVLTSIQESAWGNGIPRVDLPAVTFEYNRFQRSFNPTPIQQTPWTEEGSAFQRSLGWGIRRQGAAWPSVEGMFLDVDGDGLQDRVYVVPSGNECMFNWSKNRGRDPVTGLLQFETQPFPQPLPRLPWAGAQKDSIVEWCSLSAQFTMKTNLEPPPPTAPCPSTTGSYLAYRWLDMTGDQLPDLVTAIHYDPVHFDPNAQGWFGPWPSCTDDPECPEVSSLCVDQVTTCPSPESSCFMDEGGVNACLDTVPEVPCDYLTRQGAPGSYDDCTGTCAGNEACPQICASLDRIDPPNEAAGLGCGDKKPQRMCGRFPWMIYENMGGWFSSTPQIKYQPMPLESDGGDSSFGGGTVAASKHAVQDIDGDGNLDAVVRGGYSEGSLTVEYNNVLWLVFPGDGNGNFLTRSTGRPHAWLVPDAAPVSLSCSTLPGTICSPYLGLYVPPIYQSESDQDIRGLSTVMDVNGDGAPDLLWKFGSTQFNPPSNIFGPWENVVDSDSMALYTGTGRGFEFSGTPTEPVGRPFGASGADYFSRSYVDAQVHLGNHFMTTGLRQSRARFVDVDEDGRPDVIEAGWNGTTWESPSVFLNHGGQLLPGIPLAELEPDMWRQETAAMPTSFSPPREWGWQNLRDTLDLDGDGIPEAWDCTGNPCTHYRDPDPQPMHLMKRIRNGRGGTFDVAYGATTDTLVVTQTAGTTQNGERHAMPHTQWVVKSTSVSDQWDGDVSTTTYQYTNPVWKPDDEDDWGFRGFEEVKTIAPSGSWQVDKYGYSVDWSGRRVATRVFSADDHNNPKTVSETTWTARSLLGGALVTYHPSDVRNWTCNNGQTETACKAANSGFVHTSYTYAGLPTATPQLWYADQTFIAQSETYQVGDRRHSDTMELYSDQDEYRLRDRYKRVYQLTQAPSTETWVSYNVVNYDAALKAPSSSEVYFDAPPSSNKAVTTWQRDLATGAITGEQAPRNIGSNSFETYTLDTTRRFHSTTINEVGHTVERKYEPGTGALLNESGPSSVSCGANCTNWEQTWTDIDGLGRPIATWVNREVPGQAFWQKTQVSWTTYTDSIIGSARTKVVSEELIDYDYGSGYRTRTETQLDGQGRPDVVIETPNATPATTTYDYDNRGLMVAVTVPDPSQNSSATVTFNYDYDSLGRPSAIRRPAVGGPDSSRIDLTYDGLVHTRTEYAGSQGGTVAKTALHHDRFGRLAEVREYKEFAPDVIATTIYTYDARDTVTHIQNPDNVHTDLIHDLAGRRKQITRGGRTWTYAYNPSGEMTSEISPYPTPGQILQYTTLYGYDAIGRQTSRTVAPRDNSSGDLLLFGLSGSIALRYDTAFPGTPVCTNGVGRLCTVTFPNNQQNQPVLRKSFAYDAEGNESSETRTFNVAGIAGNRSTAATYAPGGKLKTQKYADNATGLNDGTSATFWYDNRNLPSNVDWRPAAGGDWFIDQTRNVAGLVTNRQTRFFSWYGKYDFNSDWTYDGLSRVTSQTVTRTNGATTTAVAKQQLEYFGQDDPSRLRHWLGTAPTPYDLTFDYTAQHQLKTVREASTRFSADYQFTNGGRLSYANVDGVSAPGADVIDRTVIYQYGGTGTDPEAVSALTNVFGGGNFRSYTYDLAGNMTLRTVVPLLTDDTFVYDGEDQLRRASPRINNSPQPKEEYFYDENGARFAILSRSNTGTITGLRFFMDDTELKLSSTGSLLTSYAEISLGTPVARVTNRTSLELQFHGLGDNTLASVSWTGTTQSSFVYGPYGELLETAGTAQSEQHQRFNDKYRDDATKLSYYGVRYYDGILLGWTQADPLFRVLPDGALATPRRAGLYAFTLFNPVRYLDPDGRDSKCQQGSGAGAGAPTQCDDDDPTAGLRVNSLEDAKRSLAEVAEIIWRNKNFYANLCDDGECRRRRYEAEQQANDPWATPPDEPPGGPEYPLVPIERSAKPGSKWDQPSVPPSGTSRQIGHLADPVPKLDSQGMLQGKPPGVVPLAWTRADKVRAMTRLAQSIKAREKEAGRLINRVTGASKNQRNSIQAEKAFLEQLWNNL